MLRNSSRKISMPDLAMKPAFAIGSIRAEKNNDAKKRLNPSDMLKYNTFMPIKLLNRINAVQFCGLINFSGLGNDIVNLRFLARQYTGQSQKNRHLYKPLNS